MVGVTSKKSEKNMSDSSKLVKVSHIKFSLANLYNVNEDVIRGQFWLKSFKFIGSTVNLGVIVVIPPVDLH